MDKLPDDYWTNGSHSILLSISGITELFKRFSISDEDINSFIERLRNDETIELME